MSIVNLPIKLITFFKEVIIEMKKVNWPTKPQVLRYTMIVIGVCVAVAIFLGGMDLIFSTILNKYILQ